MSTTWQKVWLLAMMLGAVMITIHVVAATNNDGDYIHLCSKWTSSKLQLKLVPQAGWGYFAGPDGIAPDEDLVTVPFDQCMESAAQASSSNDQVLLDLVERRAQLLTGDGMEVRLAAMVALAENSPYVNAMFSLTKDFPEPLPEDVLQTVLLEVAPVVALRAKRYQQLAHAILSAIVQVRNITSKAQVQTMTDRVWKSFFLVTSRSFMLYGPRSPTKATVWMVPCADLFNHRPSSSSSLFPASSSSSSGVDNSQPSARFLSNLTTGNVVVRATRRIAPGEEIFISYGAKTNADLCLQYGFVMKENPFDIVNLDVDVQHLLEEDPNRALKMKILNSHFENRGARTLRLGHKGLDTASLDLVRMLLLTPSEFSSFELSNILGRHLPPTSEKTENNAGLFVLDAIRQQLMKYYNALEVDQHSVSVMRRAPARIQTLIDENVRMLARAYKTMKSQVPAE